MRILLVGILSLTLIGCSCPAGRHVVLDACTSKPCFYRTAASPPIEPKPTPSKPKHTTTKVETKKATKTAKTSSAAAQAAKSNTIQTSNESDKDKIASATAMTVDHPYAPLPQPVESAKSTVGANVGVAVSGEASEPFDPVLKKAMATVASKMEDPASFEFEDMTRAIRESSMGLIDTICGHVRGKNTSGAETGKRAFLYLVKEDVAFVDYGYPNSAAANAYRRICGA
jgi:hypothetical protein